jgi:hypothetical protein
VGKLEKSGGLGGHILDSPSFSLKPVETLSERSEMRQKIIIKIMKGRF